MATVVELNKSYLEKKLIWFVEGFWEWTYLKKKKQITV